MNSIWDSSVAQSFTLLYRRVVLGRLSERIGAFRFSLGSQSATLRYSRVQLCAASVILCALLVSACSDNKQPATPGSRATGKIIIKGSNTIGEELAPRLIA